jgi:hypothetical protein
MPGALLVAAMAALSSAQISVYTGTPSSAIVYEDSGPASEHESGLDIEGYWTPVGHRYKWVRGHWERPVLEGAYWTHPHYDHYREGWQVHERHWDREDHTNRHRRDHDRGQGHGNREDRRHDRHD